MILRVLLAAVLGAVAVGSLLVACGQQPVPLSSDPPATDPPVVEHEPVSVPFSVSIPKLEAHSTLIPLGLTTDCDDEPAPCLETPSVTEPMQAGYWAGPDRARNGELGETLPGETGSAVVAAHVDGVIDGRRGQPGLFRRLHELAPGDEVFVEQADGGSLRFVVEETEQVDKDAFPTEKVYGRDDRPRLALITCGGEFDRASGHYASNHVVHTVIAQ